MGFGRRAGLAARTPRDASARLAAAARPDLRDGLATLGEALDDLRLEVCRNPLSSFETHGRFLETRYKDQKLPSSRFE